jgi:hypothetical protein
VQSNPQLKNASGFEGRERGQKTKNRSRNSPFLGK